MPRLIGTTPLLLITALLASASAQAHFFPETANCKGPAMPLEFVTELDRKQFDAKVAEYRGCLETFVSRQNEAMSKHKQAADNAAEAWKRYAETVLKVKLKSSDEPTPPAQ
ncbi:hypothetical protein [Motiliproteus sediminis]|uniref:hypothetical protein n=1 Tax=Motiliproteus sediminis TaxID=1468178 RepID=UPI001AEF8766|nr:hypothetical protein [Motiliproteus sediminis]